MGASDDEAKTRAILRRAEAIVKPGLDAAMKDIQQGKVDPHEAISGLVLAISFGLSVIASKFYSGDTEGFSKKVQQFITEAVPIIADLEKNIITRKTEGNNGTDDSEEETGGAWGE